MSDLDAPVDKAQQAANEIGGLVGDLWMAAHDQGILNGLAAAALLVRLYLERMPDLDISPALSHLLMLEAQIKQQMARLQVDDDAPPPRKEES